MEKQLVSVIIPSFGRPESLARSIQSVLDQDYKQLEVIVVDDNGKGQPHQLSTQKVVDEFSSSNQVRYLVHEINRGGAAARNTGVKAAKGDLLALLDNDDTYMPERISRQAELLLVSNQADPRIKACICLPVRMKYGKEVDRESAKYQRNYLYELLAIQVSLHTGSSLLMFKSAYESLGGFDEQFRRNQDIEFMIRFYEKWDTVMLNEHLIAIHIDDRSNIPGYQKILETKELLLTKFAELITRFDKLQQKEIHKSHALEIAKVALWNKNILGFLKGMLQARLGFRESLSFVKDIVKKALMHLK